MYASAAGHRAMAELQDTPSRLNAPPPPELRPALDLQRDFFELEIPPAAAHDIADVQQCPALSPLPPSRSDRTLPTFVAALPTSLPRASETLHVFTPQINQGDQGRDRAPTPMASNFKLQEDRPRIPSGQSRRLPHEPRDIWQLHDQNADATVAAAHR